MSTRSKAAPVTEGAWQACVNPYQLIRWSRRIGRSRKYLLLGCAIVRHRSQGPPSEIGSWILRELEEYARVRHPARVWLVQDFIASRFPNVFRPGGLSPTSPYRRQLADDTGWLQLFANHAPILSSVRKTLPNVLFNHANSSAHASVVASKEVDAEVARIRDGQVAPMPVTEPGFLRRFLRLRPAAPVPPPNRLRDAILSQIPEDWGPRLQTLRPQTSAMTFAQAVYLLRLYRQHARMAEMKATLAALVRDVFGDPFRPWHVHPGWVSAGHGAARHVAEHIDRTGNFADLPILADALEDAGCTDSAALAHCRDAEKHVPGCWVVDAVLGR